MPLLHGLSGFVFVLSSTLVLPCSLVTTPVLFVNLPSHSCFLSTVLYSYPCLVFFFVLCGIFMQFQAFFHNAHSVAVYS